MKKFLAAAAFLLCASAASAQPIDDQPQQPMGWIYGRYLVCVDDQCAISVQADGVNVRHRPNGHTFAALVNGTPIFPLSDTWGRWVLIAPGCPLRPTGVWSDTAGVPLLTCD
jgi:hypothetical protein